MLGLGSSLPFFFLFFLSYFFFSCFFLFFKYKFTKYLENTKMSETLSPSLQKLKENIKSKIFTLTTDYDTSRKVVTSTCHTWVTISQFSSDQLFSHVWLFATPWIAAYQASLSITNFRSLPKPMFIETVRPSNHLILCHPLLLLPSISPSIRVFSNVSAPCISWPKYWSFSFSLNPSNEHPGLISFRMDFLDLLTVQGTLKSLLQHHNSKASIFPRSAFFIVQLLHPYMTTGKTIALTRQILLAK